MRVALIAVVAFGVSGCALTRSSGPNPSQPMCMPCANPCYPSDDCAARGPKAVAAAPAPAPAPAPMAAPQPAAAPTFSPSPGSYTGTQMVALSSATPGATIHYTTDGAEPTASSTVYTGPITVSGDTTIRAIAVAPGLPDSSLSAGGFAVSQPPPPPPAAPARAVMTAEKIELKESVYFDTSKTTIKAVSLPLLDEVAQLLKDHPEVLHVTVEGHTDSAGGAALNQKLSEGRAQAVRTYLVEKGVAASRLEAKGFGASRPIADNATAKGREANRRVEFNITH